MKKKLLAILLTVCMVLSMAPAALAADSVFTDVEAGDWFAEEVKYVYDNGLMNGVGDNAFDPSGTVTRAMVWTTLARLDGVDTTGSDPWWLAGQQWAMENEISDGTMATENITREQLVTMIWRYAKYIDMDVSEGEDTNILSYTDALDVNEWAISAMQWACGAGIINGIDGALQPQGYATRAQLAAILYRFVEEVMPEEEPEPSTPVVPSYPSYPSYPSTPSHSHSYGTWDSNNNGTHSKTCAGTVGTCDAPTVTEDCTYDWDECSVCGYQDGNYYIDTVAELKAFRDDVNAGNNYSGKTIKLTADIDLNNEAWTPIGTPSNTFKGVFDGGNNTISNLKIDAPNAWAQGLFGYIATNATVQNVTVHNASVTALCMSGVIVGNVQKEGTFTNCHVTGDIEVVGGYYMGGIAGNGGYANFSNCSVIGNDGSTIIANDEDGKSFVGGIAGYRGEGTRKIENCVVKNLDITGYEAVGAIAGMAQYDNTITGCAVENVTLTRTKEDGTPFIGLASGCWTEKANDADYMTTITNNSFKNVVIAGVSETLENYLYGNNYAGSEAEIALTDSGNTYEGITQP